MSQVGNVEAEEINFTKACAYFDRLPLRSQIGTLSPAYVAADSMRDVSLMPFSIAYEEGDKFWLMSAHLSLVPNTDYWSISSPYGYGGPLANTGDVEFRFRAWAAYKKWCWEHLILAEVMKLHPLADHPYGGQIKFNRFTYACGTNYTSSCRNKVNKARGRQLVVVDGSKDAIWQHFPVDYREAMGDVKADSFYLFNDEYFKALAKIPGVSLLICEEEESWRSACIMIAGGLTMESHLTITNKRGRELGATNYLVHCARETLHADVPLYLGGGKTTKDNDPLAKFKASFGGEALRFNIGWHIHRPDVYSEMKQGNTSDRVLFWRQ